MLEDKIKKIGKFLFDYRSYTPLPFIFLMILFMKPTLLSIIIGIIIVIGGEIIRVLSVSFAGSETRTTSGVGGSNLVTQGPFRIVRNPLYIGNMLIYLGIGIMSNSFFPYLQIIALLYFFFQYYAIILNEEEYLLSAFKEKFSAYCATVNRFLPSVNKIPDSIKSEMNFSLRDGFKSEKRTLQAIIIIVSLILANYIYLNYL